MQRVRVDGWTLLVPETRRERARGLLGRSDLPPHEGLLLERCRSIHTFGMRFSIDVVLLDRDFRVIDVLTLPPRRLLLPRPRLRHIVEVSRGEGRVLVETTGEALATGRSAS